MSTSAAVIRRDGLRQIDADPDVGHVAGGRRSAAQAAAALHHDAKAINAFAVDAHRHRAAIVGVDAEDRPGAAAVARAPQLDLADAGGADRIDFIFQLERSRVDHPRPFAAGQHAEVEGRAAGRGRLRLTGCAGSADRRDRRAGRGRATRHRRRALSSGSPGSGRRQAADRVVERSAGQRVVPSAVDCRARRWSVGWRGGARRRRGLVGRAAAAGLTIAWLTAGLPARSVISARTRIESLPALRPPGGLARERVAHGARAAHRRPRAPKGRRSWPGIRA